jgi:hypothetical protein
MGSTDPLRSAGGGGSVRTILGIVAALLRSEGVALEGGVEDGPPARPATNAARSCHTVAVEGGAMSLHHTRVSGRFFHDRGRRRARHCRVALRKRRPPFQISVLSALPSITVPVTIDGTSQPGCSGAMLIDLDGTSTGSGIDGLVLAAGSDR